MTAVLDSPPRGAARPRAVTAGPRLAGLALAVAALGGLAVLSVTLGVRDVSLEDLLAALGGLDENVSQAAVHKRLPRTLLAMLVGAALGLAGAVMQGVTRNPLADPGILGVTAGASLAVVVGIAFAGLSSPTGFIWVAIAGAAASAVFVYVVGSLGRGGATPLKLALAGAATSAAFSSLISAILLPRIAVMDSFRFWQTGGVGGANLERIGTVLPFLLIGTLLCLVVARGLNSLALGDDLAAGLGERIALTRAAAATGAVLLCGAATAVAGPIGFVGLVVPHACRLLGGSDHRWLLPLSMVVGAALLTAADLVGRLVARPSEVDVGIITALVGAPVFIVVVRRMRGRAL
ncbi:FecCD family ABC transporter permease [Ornithinimicrobium cerasi]|uniref:Iron complex transport system permease protein n=1 Tax=Ornithinimicrobium cerasi TaxID=2248773 RepID=A0A285VRI2_9MICO|nr:iron complex transport system permease protein [Ornithinimicrobium cerasi]